jgi:hypothetical protein
MLMYLRKVMLGVEFDGINTVAFYSAAQTVFILFILYEITKVKGIS